MSCYYNGKLGQSQTSQFRERIFNTVNLSLQVITYFVVTTHRGMKVSDEGPLWVSHSGRHIS
jgi:hypothetical protein